MSNITTLRGEDYSPLRDFEQLNIKNEPCTPGTFSPDYATYFDNQKKKSLSMSDITRIREYQINSIKEEDDKELNYAGYRRPTLNEHQPLCKSKFVSVAEAIYRFQRDTPDRFHSSRIRSTQDRHDKPLRLTRPQSPVLLCRARSRQRHNYISQKEKEDMEIEELKKFKIKAHPVPKSVIEGSRNLPDVPKKPSTVPEPFKLTEVNKKPAYVSPLPAFKARPVPKHILEKPQLPVKPLMPVTKPISPKFHSKPIPLKQNGCNSADKKQKPAEAVPRHAGKVHPIPFSFEKRDELLKKKKEEKIKQQIELEKKEASLFKAKPIPGIVRKNMRTTTKSSNVSSTSSDNKENYHFEARPASVLFKKPFKPEKQVRAIIPVEFDMNTDKRAVERQQFDYHLKQKEAEMERLRKEREKELLETEKKEIAALRAQQVHHAKPACIKSPYVPQKSLLPITMPETPKFVRRINQKSAK